MYSEKKNVPKDLEVLKPQRAHHCNFCDRCCAEMNSHCFMIGNCVGLMNKKYYFQYCILVMYISLQIISQYSCLGYYQYHLNTNLKKDKQLANGWPIISSYCIAIFAFYKTSIIVINNLILGFLLNGRTSIEQKLKNQIRRKGSRAPEPFNKGCKRNCWHVFGHFGIGWFLPLPTDFYDDNFKKMVNKWNLQKGTDINNKELPFIQGVSVNMISEEFYDYAHKFAKDQKQQIETKLEYTIQQKFKSFNLHKKNKSSLSGSKID